MTECLRLTCFHLIPKASEQVYSSLQGYCSRVFRGKYIIIRFFFWLGQVLCKEKQSRFLSTECHGSKTLPQSCPSFHISQVLLRCGRHTLISCFSWSKWITSVNCQSALWPHRWSKSFQWFSCVLRNSRFPSLVGFFCTAVVMLDLRWI